MRFLRALPSAAGLLILLAGIPAALILGVGWPLPHHWPSGTAWRIWVHQPLTTRFLLDASACVIWLLWALLLAGAAAAGARAARRARIPAVRLPAPIHALTASLVGTTVAAITGTAASAAVHATHAAPLPAGAATGTGELPSAAPTLPDGSGMIVIAGCGYQYTVVHGDSLSIIAEHCLGSARRWPEIWHLNRGRTWPTVSGYRRLDDPDLILPRWILHLPDDAVPPTGSPELHPHPSHHPGPATGPGTSTPATSTPAGPDPTGPPTPIVRTSAPLPATPPPVVDGGVDLPGGDWIAVGLATAISAAGAGVWARRRRRYKPRPPTAGLRLDDPDLTPLAVTVRRASHPRTSLDAEIDGGAGTVEFRPEPAGSLMPPASPMAAGTGLGIVGDGAESAARGILATALTIRAGDGGRTLIVTTTTTLTRLLGDTVPALPLLYTADTLGAALDLIEQETLARARLLYEAEVDDLATLRRASADMDLPLSLLLIADSGPDHQQARIAALLSQGDRLGVHGLVLGDWPPGTTITVAADGTTLGSDGTATGRMSVLDHHHTLDILTFIAGSEPGPAPGPSTPAATEPATAANTATTALPPFTLDHREPTNGSTIDDDTGQPRRLAMIRVLGGIPQILHLPPDSPTKPALRGKARELLAYLLLHPGGVREDAIFDHVLADIRVRQVKSHLNTHVYNLRLNLRAAAGPGDYIIRDGTNLRLDSNTLDCDLWRMHRHLATAESATSTQEQAAALNAAISAYSGPFADSADYDWAEPYREAIRRQIIDACATRANILTPTDPAAALAVTRLAINHDKYNEVLYQQALRLAATIGDTRAGRTLAAAAASALAEIDAEPDDTTTRLIEPFRRRSGTAEVPARNLAQAHPDGGVVASVGSE